MDIEKIFNGLESNQTHECEDAKRKLVDLFSQHKADWLVHGMMEYFLKTGSQRIIEVLVKVQSPYDNYIFDRLADWMKTTHRVQALNFFCFVVRKHPTWLFKVEKHRLIKDIFKLLLAEKEIVPLMSALICIITLLPIIPSYVPNFLNELFDVFGHLATWNCQNPYKLSDDKLVHLQLGVQMLFHRLYGMYPCNFLAYLSDFSKKEKGAIFHHTIKPLLETVRVHPLLVTATTETEMSNVRWKEMEPHDVVMECARLSLPLINQDGNADSVVTVRAPKSSITNTLRNMTTTTTTTMTSTSATTTSRGHPVYNYKEISHFDGGASAVTASNAAIWSPYNEIAKSGPIPLTPTPCMVQGVQYLSVTGTSPPEAAVEATPETTPMKDIKELRHAAIAAAASSGVANRNAVRAIFPSQPSSPMRKEYNTFSFPDVGTSEGIGATGMMATTTRTTTTTTVEEVSIGTTTYDRRLQQLMQERMHSKSPFQTIDAQGTSKGFRSPVDATLKSHTTESDSNTPKSHLMHSASTTTMTPVTIPTPSTAIPVENITKVCVDCNETEGRMCTSGGLQMPTSRSMQLLARSMKRRNRMTSYCYNDSSCEKVGASKNGTGMPVTDTDGDSDVVVKVRRTKSCSSICMAVTSGFKTDDATTDDDSDNNQKQQQERRLQKSGKMLAIAKATKRAVGTSAATPLTEHMNAGTQTVDVLPYNYEDSLFKELAYTNDIRSLVQPLEILDQFISGTLYSKESCETSCRSDQEQLQLLCLQLQYERYRREIHAERNRRLMGRSRDKRSLEMERNRLREQLKNFDLKNKELMYEIDKTIKKTNEREKCYLDELTALKTKYQKELEKNRCLRQANENLQTRLSEELTARKDMNYELEALRGQLFNMKSELQHAQVQADIGLQCKQELARLEAEFIVMGEVQIKCRDRLAEIDNFRARDQELQMLQEAYNTEIKDLKHTLDEKSSSLDGAKHKIHELQSQLSNNEKVITEQKRLIKAIKDGYEEKFKSLNKKYDVQKSIITQMEEKIMMSLHKPQTTAPNATCSPDTEKTDVASSMDRNSPLSLSLASSESLSASLRSTELRNLQTLVEASESSAISVVANAARANIIEGTRLPALDMASSANTATLSMASAINIVPSASATSSSNTTALGAAVAVRKGYELTVTTMGHTHPHLHLQQPSKAPPQKQEPQPQPQPQPSAQSKRTQQQQQQQQQHQTR